MSKQFPPTLRKSADEMTLEDIEAERANAAATAKREAQAADALVARLEVERAEANHRCTVREALAALLGCASSDSEPLSIAINMRASTKTAIAPLWECLQRVTWTRGQPGDAERAITSVLCLVAAGELPAPAKDSQVFGAAAIKRARDLPPSPKKGLPRVPHAYDDLARVVGLDALKLKPTNVESYEQTLKRTREIEQRDGYDRDSPKRNRELAEKERSLMDVRRSEAAARARRDLADAKAKQRAGAIAAIDRVLADRSLDLAWWWARELRAHFAGEPTAISDPERVWHTCCALGIRFPFAVD